MTILMRETEKEPGEKVLMVQIEKHYFRRTYDQKEIDLMEEAGG
jgi:hypothetical protein